MKSLFLILVGETFFVRIFMTSIFSERLKRGTKKKDDTPKPAQVLIVLKQILIA